MGGVPAASVSSDAAERLRLRYPRSRLPRPILVTAVALLALTFVSWLVWSASVQASPPVSATVSGYRVLSDQAVAVTLTVQRPEPSKAVVCHLVAQAEDFQIVGAVDQRVPPRSEKLVDVALQLKTLRRATSASVKGCSLA
jgi:hypothetical protein